jgi:hypothetical protein
MRIPRSNNLYRSYTAEELALAAWDNVPAIPGSPHKRDCDGRFILWSERALLTTYGWEVDHIIPLSLGGLDVPWNVRARHWWGNRSAGGVLGTILDGVRR